MFLSVSSSCSDYISQSNANHTLPHTAADANAPDAHATQDDVARIITQIKLRDERIAEAEAELRALRDDMWRAQEEQRKLREDTLPLIRLAKDKSAPLPTPDGQERGNPLSPIEGSANASNSQGSSLARKFSKKGLYLGGKMPSPTIHEGTGLEASAAAMAASNHLTASMTSSQGQSQGQSQSSPRLSQQPSPTSPSYTQNRSFNERAYWQAESERDQQSRVQTPLTARRPGTASIMNPLNTNLTSAAQQQQAQRDTQLSQATTVVARDSQAATPSSEHGPDHNGLPLSSTEPSAPSSRRTKEQKPPEAADFMKSFRVGMEEPCFKVLPQALKKYNIVDNWRLYSLYIVHGDQERCLGLDERPLILFKQLANEGKKPMFMLRKHAAPAVGTVRTVDHSAAGPGGAGAGAGAGLAGSAGMPGAGSGGGAAAGQGPGQGAGQGGGVGSLSAGRQSYASPMQLPGGVL